MTVPSHNPEREPPFLNREKDGVDRKLRELTWLLAIKPSRYVSIYLSSVRGLYSSQAHFATYLIPLFVRYNARPPNILVMARKTLVFCSRASLLLFVLGVTCFSVASAKDVQSGIFGSDDRRVIEQLNVPWTAIGQVNVTGYRSALRCTGSLIASNLVITAAHSVMDSSRGKPFPLHQIHFVAGVRLAGSFDRPVSPFPSRLS
jgi:hypothetical protein